MDRLLAALILSFIGFASAGSAEPVVDPIKLWRLDCGTIDVDLASFSDTGLYQGERRTLAASCYLIGKGNQFLLWDTGLDGALAGKPKDAQGSFLKERLIPQLARIGVEPNQITFVGISHYHYDHTGQIGDFPAATLLIGKKDFEVVQSRDQLRTLFAPWVNGEAKVEELAGDKDVFGDGTVTILMLPGHTPGHSALLVKLASGPVLLSGDQYHFTEQVANRGVPSFNFDRANTLASHDRFDRLAENLRARVIIQHEPRDIAKLPTFPQAAE